MIDQRDHASDGERRKRDALTLLQAQREVFVRRGRRALLARLLRQGTATADDVRADVQLPPDFNPKLFGAVPGALADAGLIRNAGYARTTRPEAHARPLSIWILDDPAGALAWLAAHPDIPDDDATQRGLFDGLT